MPTARTGARAGRKADKSVRFIPSGVTNKCRPPVGLKTRFCVPLEAVLAPESNQYRAGVYVVQLMKFSTGDLWVGGVAARKSAKDKPVFFNYCPFCGEPVDYFKKTVDKKVAR